MKEVEKMELYQEILENLSNKYNQRIAENLPLLIEAFTRFMAKNIVNIFLIL